MHSYRRDVSQFSKRRAAQPFDFADIIDTESAPFLRVLCEGAGTTNPRSANSLPEGRPTLRFLKGGIPRSHLAWALLGGSENLGTDGTYPSFPKGGRPSPLTSPTSSTRRVPRSFAFLAKGRVPRTPALRSYAARGSAHPSFFEGWDSTLASCLGPSRRL